MTESNEHKNLRGRAEAQLREAMETEQPLSREAMPDVIHELRVHQIELEMQNDELRRAQQALETARERYRDLYEQAPVGYLTLQYDGRITQANRTSARLLGVAQSALRGKPLSHCIAPESQDAYHFLRVRLREDQLPQTAELAMARADGTIFWARLDVTVCTPPCDTPDDQPPAFRVTLSDITQLHALLYHLQEQQQRMLFTLAHELRVPATLINGYLPLLLAEWPADHMTEKQETIVAALHHALDRMQTMIDEVTTIISLESGQYPLHLTPVALDTFLDELLAHYAGIAEVSSHLSLAIPHDLPCILADPHRLETILVNLLLNAHHAAPKASVRISANAQGQQVIISITDQGPGIPADEMPRIFDLFYRVEHGEQTKGIGLALAITKAWVIAQGGQIWVESVVGHGSTFSFTLPIAESACSGSG